MLLPRLSSRRFSNGEHIHHPTELKGWVLWYQQRRIITHPIVMFPYARRRSDRTEWDTATKLARCAISHTEQSNEPNGEFKFRHVLREGTMYVYCLKLHSGDCYGNLLMFSTAGIAVAF